MERLLVKCVLWGLLVLVQIHGNKSCFEEERLSLLDLKAFLLSTMVREEEDTLLPSWVDSRNSECCGWERVTCESTTGHVTGLALQSDGNYFSFSGLLNISLFLPFRELMNLDLSANNFSCCIKNEGFDKLSSLKRLEVLNLARNLEFGNILQPLGALTSLKNLNLRDIGLVGGLFPPEFSSLKNLQVLDLSRNSYNGSLQGFCELNNLEELDLSYNSFEGSIPLCVEKLKALKHLDLSSNQFTGNIPSSVTSSLTSLEYIDLSHNQFEGVFPFNSFSNHSKLKEVLLSDNSRKLEVETECSGWVPMFQLDVLVLSNCNLNEPGGIIPGFLLSQYQLSKVDLSHNNLKGTFPYWLLENNTRLEYLFLRNNSFSGQLHLPANRSSRLYTMDVSSNHFQGQLQENVGEMIQSVSYLNLSRNAFEGRMPSSICNMSSLQVMDLSFNNFSGEVPKELLAGCVTAISALKLSSNRFHGQSSFNLTRLMTLYLDGNLFTGTLANIASKIQWLVTLDIGYNSMSGEFPSWISNVTSLAALVMRENFFEGQLPMQTMQWLDILDVSHNSLSGSLPSFPILWNVKHVHLHGNRFSESVPRAFLNSTRLLTLDIRDNSLSGSIPWSINSLPKLRVLLLRGNQFSGSIPHELCQSNKVRLMDLSSNSFTGPIPCCFGGIAFGMVAANDPDFGFERAFAEFPTVIAGAYGSGNLVVGTFIPGSNGSFYHISDEQNEVEFVTKSNLRSYKGDILGFMSGLDLSCNNLTGEIPHELGNLSSVHALNLSHNQFKGSIPKSFSNLSQLESLDLSHNSLNGEIPRELLDLNFLGVFTVAYNNLSGRMPDMKAQFATFDKSSYEGNPFLCGPPLDNNCSSNLPAADSKEDEGKWYEVDPTAFWSSFGASFMVILLGFATILYVNPYWRRRWFYFVEECMYSCYYFVLDAFYKLSSYLSK